MTASVPSKKSTRSRAKSGSGVSRDIENLRFKLSNHLQSSLILETTMELFFRTIKNVIHCEGLCYSYLGIELDFGIIRKGAHSATYKVNAPQEQLGELHFYRQEKYTEPELTLIEMLIGVLFYPLRNSLKYREAVENSLRDPLTGIGNRSAMETAFAREIKLSQRHSSAMSVALIDVDHFKAINDQFGHQLGDQVLREVAQQIQLALRETDQVFRFGGEEFIALLHETDNQNAQKTAERIRAIIAAKTFAVDDQFISATVSIGVSSLNRKDSMNSLIARADEALYKAKHAGRNQVMCAKTRSASNKAVAQGAA